MPVFVDSGYSGRVTWLGRVAERRAGLEAAPVAQLLLGFAGAEGEDHGGLTRPACSRVRNLYARNRKIRNTRQLSLLSQEELAEIASRMGVDVLDPALLGATMVVEGLPDFSHVPPSSRLQIAGGATLVVDVENRPCQLPARPIEGRHPGAGQRFRSAARDRRGVTAWVEAEGVVHLGDSLRLFVPSQRPWVPPAA